MFKAVFANAYTDIDAPQRLLRLSQWPACGRIAGCGNCVCGGVAVMPHHGGMQPSLPWDAWVVAPYYVVVAVAAAGAAVFRVARSGALARRVGCAMRAGEAAVALLALAAMVVNFMDQYLRTHVPKSEGDAPTRWAVLVARASGHVVETALALALLPVSRGSPWLRALGVPFDAALRWHRVGAATALGIMTAHVAFWWAAWVRQGAWVDNAVFSRGYIAAAGDGSRDDPTVPHATIGWLLGLAAACFAFERCRRRTFEAFLYRSALFCASVTYDACVRALAQSRHDARGCRACVLPLGAHRVRRCRQLRGPRAHRARAPGPSI